MIRLPILIAATIALAPIALAQTAATDPFAHSPTSLQPTEALPRTPDGKPDFQNVVWATNYFPVFEATPMKERESSLPIHLKSRASNRAALLKRLSCTRVTWASVIVVPSLGGEAEAR